MVSQKSDIARQVIEEHEELNQNIGELKITILEKVSTKDFPDWRIQFIGKLQDLKQKLTSHFEFEEQGGFMAEVIDEAPQLLNQVKELEIEHKQILASLDDVVKDFKKLDVKDDLELQDIFNRVSRIMNKLHHHEMTENELLQSAFYREHGSPD
jgi:iron-sulfur cluster repair protein YtfE (RIC family)